MFFSTKTPKIKAKNCTFQPFYKERKNHTFLLLVAPGSSEVDGPTRRRSLRLNGLTEKEVRELLRDL